MPAPSTAAAPVLAAGVLAALGLGLAGLTLAALRRTAFTLGQGALMALDWLLAHSFITGRQS